VIQAERELVKTPTSRGSVVFLGLTITVGFVALLFVSMSSSDYSTWGALVIGPVLLFISLPLLWRQAVREDDSRVFWFLTLALFLKLCGAAVAYFVAFDLYGGQADVTRYHEAGLELAPRFRVGDFSQAPDPITGTNFPGFLVGIIYAITGPSKLGGFIVHGWLAFWGLFLFYRAFLLAVPEGRASSYAKLVFLLPSQLMWSSLMGKDPWMVMALGVTAFGVAHILTGKMGKGLLVFGLGSWLALLVRPHMAGMMGCALVAGYLARKTGEHLRELAPIAKGAALVVLVAAASVLVVRTNKFLEDSGVETDKGVTTSLEQTSSMGAYGGSYFAPSIVRSPANIPMATLTVLFRPLLNEVDNIQGLITALEGAFLILFTLWRIPWGLAALKSIRRQPYVAFAAVYTGIFIFAYSSFSNFGLLARQRVQLMPLYFVLLAIPPLLKKEDT
jgi:hypothetical protein